MKRKKFLKRENYEHINDELGFDFQVIDHKKYWLEDVGYEFTPRQVDLVEEAANELHQMCFAAIDNVIQKNRFKELNVPEKMIPFIKKSWNREDWAMYGRFDFCFDGKKLKMLEYNADTPTSLVEASLAQWEWMKGQNLPDQFNSIDEKMVAWWQAYKEQFNPSKVYFTTVKENHEDFRNTEYIMDAATRAGIETDFIFIEDLGSDGDYFYDLENNRIEFMFKLYPWEWMVQENEEFLNVILKDNCQIIEPAWKMILSNKAILAILWELFPNHKFLLPTYFTPAKLGSTYVKKPFLSREGQNVEIIRGMDVEGQKGLYQSDFNVYQELCELPKFDDVYAVVGAWVVGEEACGLGIREDQSKITANLSCFAPHYIFEESVRAQKPQEDRYKIKEEKMSYYEQEVQEKEGFNWSNIVVIILVVAMSVWGVSALVEGDNKVKAKNQEVNAYNATQREALGKIFSESNKATVDNWISTYVSKENTEVFKKFYQLNRELVTKGVGSKDAFFEVDKSLTNLVFCVQGEKDVENLNHFMENLIFDTPEHKQIVTYLKNKYNYSDKKITMPSEEDILEMCDFKSFDKDLKTANQTLNEQITDPSKKVIIEDVE